MWYDEKQGISEAIRTLDGFNRLEHARREAGYDRHERLNEWLIFNGRVLLDTCGNTMIGDRTPKPWHRYIPDVCTNVEGAALVKQHAGDDRHCWYSACSWTPDERIVCPICGQGWNIANWWDYYFIEGNSEVVDLAPYIGKTIPEVWELYKARTDGFWCAWKDSVIRNDRYIDLTSEPGTDYPRNRMGWVDAHQTYPNGTVRGEIDLDTYRIQTGDETLFRRMIFEHLDCHKHRMREDSRESFRKIFVLAGFAVDKMIEIPNEYGSFSYNGAWYKVITPQGLFKIGWRKRVIELDWSATGLQCMHLFDGEDVTKGNMMIHCWGDEKAVEYLAKILQFAKEQVPA